MGASIVVEGCSDCASKASKKCCSSGSADPPVGGEWYPKVLAMPPDAEEEVTRQAKVYETKIYETQVMTSGVAQVNQLNQMEAPGFYNFMGAEQMPSYSSHQHMPWADAAQPPFPAPASHVLPDLSSFDKRSGQPPTEAEMAQKIVRNFTERFQKGLKLLVTSTDRAAAECNVCLDRKLEIIVVQRPQRMAIEERNIRLEHIVQVIVGVDHERKLKLPVDRLSVSMLMSDSHAFNFQFGSIDERDIFAVCLSTFVDVCREKKEERRRLRDARPMENGVVDSQSMLRMEVPAEVGPKVPTRKYRSR